MNQILADLSTVVGKLNKTTGIKIQTLYFDWASDSIIEVRADLSHRPHVQVKPKSVKPVKERPWSCCGARVPAGERCPVCGDTE